MNLEDICVIVAAKNEGGYLRDCVDSLLVASEGKSEIIVVDDRSSDDSSQILSFYSDKIKVLKGEGMGPGRARNMAMRETSKAWIAFTDGDCEVPENWLRILSDGLSQTKTPIAGIGGGQLVSHRASPGEKWVAEFLLSIGFVSDYMHESDSARPVKHNPTCNVLYDRKAIESVGVFDESLWPCEDLDLDIRLGKVGHRFLFQPGAAVEHRRPDSSWGLLKMMNRYGSAHAHLVKKYGLCQLLHLLPVLAPFVFLVPLRTLLGVFFLTAVVFLLRTRSLSKAIGYPFVLAGSVGAWLFGFYCGLFKGKRIAKQDE